MSKLRTGGSSPTKLNAATLLRRHHKEQSLVELSESSEPLVLSIKETQQAHSINTEARSGKQQATSTRP